MSTPIIPDDFPPDLTWVPLAYQSRVDGVGPLYADCIFRADGQAKPMAAVLHGFHCKSRNVTGDAIALARRGLFCVAPDMRGHATSAGQHDVGILQLTDIVDALELAARTCPGELNPQQISAVGYSGGGGNVMGLCAKFPDLLHAGAAFFGISDYELWYRSEGRVDCNRTMDKAIGGGPDQFPERYAARSALYAVGNNPWTHLQVFWDSEEKACPPFLNEWYLAAAKRLGLSNIVARRSQPGDAARWFHGYRFNHPILAAGDDLFAPEFLAPRPAPVWPEQGELAVAGYVVTRHFAAWFGDGSEGRGRIHYDLRGTTPQVTLISGPTNRPLRVITGPSLLAWRHGQR
jgi:pimeloyl-ACP methyl ester carboxylesterase